MLKNWITTDAALVVVKSIIISMVAAAFRLGDYLRRVNVPRPDPSGLAPTLALLSTLMEAQSRAVPFENLDVVRGGTVSMDAGDVFHKLVVEGRGGYCFEQNTLLQHALSDIGFQVEPVLCRVRWGKAPEQRTPFTHMMLHVTLDDGVYIADVGFAGTNSISPVRVADGVPQTLADGTFRTRLAGRDTVLEVQDRKDPSRWRALYEWKTDRWETAPDLDLSNWFSCTAPTARFTNQLFLARLVRDSASGRDEKCHLLNDELVRRSLGGELVDRRELRTEAALVEAIRDTFGLPVEAGTGLDKYM